MEIAEIGFVSYVASFLLLLTVLVFIHEWGHFSVARLLGVRVRTFSIGFGPEIFGWYDKKGTRWKISWIPLGGYVMFFGDAGVASNPDSTVQTMNAEDRAVSFHHQSLATKAAIIAAGPLINFAFAILVFAGLFMAYGQQYSTPVISSVIEDSAAFEAGLEQDDLIIAIDEETIDRFEQVSAAINMRPDQTLIFTVLRDQQEIRLAVTPRKNTEEDRFGNQYVAWRVGITGKIEVARRRNPLSALYHAALHTADMTHMMLSGIGQIILGIRSVDEMGGPLKIAQFSGQQASMGAVSFIAFMALISINLGLVNLFPIPMLDGGHLMFYGMEAIRGKPVSLRVQEFSMIVGMTLVIGLMIFLTWNDLNSFNVMESINRLFS